jgi:hypothetical protein
MAGKQFLITPKSLMEPKREQFIKGEGQNRNHRIQVRLFPIWLRIILVVFFVIVSMLVGAVIGYSVIGNGKPMDALKFSTWNHIRDFVTKN